MIFDFAANLDFYRNLGIEGRYAKAVDFLKSHDLKTLENGRHEIDGMNVYANVMELETVPWEEAKYEYPQGLHGYPVYRGGMRGHDLCSGGSAEGCGPL